MEKKKLTLRQKIAYAHWVAKQDTRIWGYNQLIASVVIYLGLILWFFESDIRAINFSGEHALAKRFIIITLSAIVLTLISYITVYIIHFIKAFFDNDDVYRQHFLRYYYHKH